MTFERLSEKFKSFDGPYPEEGLIESIEKQELITPGLLKVLQNSLDDPQGVIDRDDYMMSIFSMYLLAQFREKKAYPVIIDFFSMPDHKAMEIVGDMYIEDLGRILASVSCGDISLLQGLIENREAQELLRAAAVEALLVLVNVGEISRDMVIDYFKTLFAGKLERQRSPVWVSLVSASVDLYPQEVWVEIETAFFDDLVDERLIDRGKVDDVLALEKEQVLEAFFKKSQYSLIEDVIQEFK